MYLHAEGYRLGARLPNLAERARIMGAPEYWAGMACDARGLTRRQILDAQGNSFDPRMIATRVGPHVEAWLHGNPLPSQ